MIKLDSFPSRELRDLISEYKKWPERNQQIEKGRQASELTKTLGEALIERGNLTWKDFDTLYFMVLWRQKAKPSTKKAKIDELKLEEPKKDEIKKMISESTGAWGTGTYTFRYELDTESKEKAVEELLSTFLREEDEEKLDSAVESFANKNISGIQSGVLSPLLYCLHPTKYPIINSRSRESIEKLLNITLTGSLKEYVEEKSYFLKIKDEFNLRDDMRDLDVFLGIWLPDVKWGEETTQEITETEEPKSKTGMFRAFEEKFLRRYLAENSKLIESDLELIKENEQVIEGRGRPDLVFKDKDSNFLVVEIKKGRGSRKVIGQISEYITQVMKKMAKGNQTVRGLIVAYEVDEALKDATYANPKIEIQKYNLKCNLEDVSLS